MAKAVDISLSNGLIYANFYEDSKFRVLFSWPSKRRTWRNRYRAPTCSWICQPVIIMWLLGKIKKECVWSAFQVPAEHVSVSMSDTWPHTTTNTNLNQHYHFNVTRVIFQWLWHVMPAVLDSRLESRGSPDSVDIHYSTLWSSSRHREFLWVFLCVFCECMRVCAVCVCMPVCVCVCVCVCVWGICVHVCVHVCTLQPICLFLMGFAAIEFNAAHLQAIQREAPHPSPVLLIFHWLNHKAQ